VRPMSSTTPTDTPTLVNVQFRVALTKAELVQAFEPEAPKLAKYPHMRWKLWTLDERTREFSGVYLFDNERAAREYLDGPVVAALRADPHFSDVRANAYPVLEGLSRVTRGPVG